MATTKRENLSIPPHLTVAELQSFPADMKINVEDSHGYSKPMTARDLVKVEWPGPRTELTIARRG